jgi:phosphatidylcholine synthase
MKTDDGYFRGFPALWNVVAFYFVLLPMGEWVAAGIVAGLVVLTFAPVHVVHPFRARDSKMLAPAAAMVWAAATLILAVAALGGAVRSIALGLSLASLLVLTAIGLLRTLRGREA